MEDGRYSDSPPASPDALSDQLEQFRDRIRLFAAGRLRNWVEAEDVAQEALRRALEALRAGRIVNTDALPAFLYKTAIHICQNRSRSAGRETRALRRVGASSGQIESDPLQTLISAEQLTAVRRALEKLGAEDREVLTLSYAGTCEAAAIGRRLNLTAGNVRVRRHRALRRLAQLLGVTSGADRGHKE